MSTTTQPAASSPYLPVRDDWLAYFEEKAVPKPAGVAVLTDSDDTDSSAQGDYANFRACRQ